MYDLYSCETAWSNVWTVLLVTLQGLKYEQHYITSLSMAAEDGIKVDVENPYPILLSMLNVNSYINTYFH